MLQRSLLATMLCAALAAHAETPWFTLAGTPGDDTSDYIQLDPTSVQGRGQFRTLALRVSRNAERISTDGVHFRSFEATAEVDCMNKTSRFTSSTFFGEPHFAGAPVATLVFDRDKDRPVAFRKFAADYASRLISATCSIGRAAAPASAARPG